MWDSSRLYLFFTAKASCPNALNCIQVIPFLWYCGKKPCCSIGFIGGISSSIGVFVGWDYITCSGCSEDVLSFLHQGVWRLSKMTQVWLIHTHILSMEEVVGSNMLCFQLRDDAPNFRLSISADGSSTGGTIDADLSQKLMVYHFFLPRPKKIKCIWGGIKIQIPISIGKALERLHRIGLVKPEKKEQVWCPWYPWCRPWVPQPQKMGFLVNQRMNGGDHGLIFGQFRWRNMPIMSCPAKTPPFLQGV